MIVMLILIIIATVVTGVIFARSILGLEFRLVWRPRPFAADAHSWIPSPAALRTLESTQRTKARLEGLFGDVLARLHPVGSCAAPSAQFVDPFELTGDQSFFLGACPALELTLTEARIRRRHTGFLVDELYGTSKGRVGGAEAGIVLVETSNDVEGTAYVESTVGALEDVNGLTRGHCANVQWPAMSEREGSERWCPSTRRFSGSLRTPIRRARFSRESNWWAAWGSNPRPPD